MRFSRRAVALILLVPAIVYAVFLLTPLFSLARLSLMTFGLRTGLRETVTMGNYEFIGTEPYYLQIWLDTVRLSIEASVISVIVGTLIAYHLWRVGGRYRAYLTAALLAPLLVSGVVRAYGWIVVIGPGGAVENLSDRLGLGKVSMMYNEPAVVLGYVNVFLPFVVINVLIRLDAIPLNILRAAANLGATDRQIATRVLLPLAYRSMVSSFLLVFALSTAAYTIPAVLGGGKVMTVAQAIVLEQYTTFNWPRGAALGVMLALSMATVMFVYQFVLARRDRGSAFGHV